MASTREGQAAGRFEWLGPTLLAVAACLSLVIALRGITSESAVSLQGDMPRYLMDGVFLRDLLATRHDLSFHGLLDFAQHYYVQYPALSIGHHPPMLSIVLVPFFAVFGVSVEVARLVMAGFALLAVLLLYAFTRRLYDAPTAGWTCLIFVTMPYLAGYSQSVLSEMPAIACVLATANMAMRFRETGRVREYLLLIGLAIASLSARQLALFVFPMVALLVLRDQGWRRFTQPKIYVVTAAGVVLMAAVAAGTILLSPFNVAAVADVIAGTSAHLTDPGPFIVIAQEQIRWPLLVVAAAGFLSSLIARDARVAVPAAWVLSVLAGVVFVTGPLEPARYSILAVPAYCVLAAGLWPRVSSMRVRPIAAAVGVLLLAALVVQQSVAALAIRPAGGHGYEEAASYVLAHGTAPTVLYSGVIDTGYFVFFVRKHDPARRLVVLRSDKMLTTSQMAHLSVEDRITDRGQIYDVLRQFGTRYVVIEDVPSGTRVIDWLRDEVRTPRFAERLRVPIDTSDRRLRGADIVVYEYLDATAPAPDAQIDVKLPVVGREIRLPLSAFRSPAAASHESDDQ